MARPKDIGTAAETAVVRFLQANGFPQAERRALHGAVDLGDITGTPGVCWEVKGGEAAKNASDGLVEQWLAEADAERRNAGAEIGVLVVQRRGIGPRNAGRWWAIWSRQLGVGILVGSERVALAGAPIRMHLGNVVTALRGAGFGDPL